MECLGVKPRAAWWKAQTNPLSYDGTPRFLPKRKYSNDCLENCPHPISKKLTTSFNSPEFEDNIGLIRSNIRQPGLKQLVLLVL